MNNPIARNLAVAPVCRKCGNELTEENWYPSDRKWKSYLCKECNDRKKEAWRKANPEKAKAGLTTDRSKEEIHQFSKNKECSLFLGVHVAERVLSHVFKDVKVMPMHNPGYDIICNKNKLIDIKSSCIRKDGNWAFQIRYNTIADFFLCLAFDNREDLTPLHAWLLPGDKFNNHKNISISPSTISKWDAYRLDLSKVSECCEKMRGD
jgi:hypothetical protein